MIFAIHGYDRSKTYSQVFPQDKARTMTIAKQHKDLLATAASYCRI
ncbi:hypothetical protein [Sedimenticola sp.]